MTEPAYQEIDPAQIETIDGNPNRMDPDQFERLVKAIDRLGFLQPVLVRKNPDPESVPFVLVDGEHRLRAFLRLGGGKIPAIVVEHGADIGEALRIGMNRLRGELSLTAVADSFEHLMRDDAWSLDDLELTGFASDEIERLLDAVRPDDLDTIEVAAVGVADEKPRRFALSISFDTEADRARVKAALLDAAGEDGSLSEGLLALLR